MYVGRVERLLAHYAPLPVCIVSSQGKVTRASSRIVDVFKYDGIVDYDIFALTGFKIQEIVEAAAEGKPLYLDRNDKNFKVLASMIGEGESASCIMVFIDETPYVKLKSLYKDEKVCLAMVNIDNFDELASSTSEECELEFTTEIDRFIRNWARDLDAAVIRYKENLYEIVLTHEDVDNLIEDKFSVLDRAREIKTEADFPVTLSIGIGMGGKTLAELDEYAQDALDMALGRGGDQAVVKNIRSMEYFGGKTQSVEKGNKGKSRILGHALKALIKQSSKVFIMGHRNPDMDCFGAALGIHRMAVSAGKEPYIVMGHYDDSMVDIISDAKDTDGYAFISAERALSLTDENSLVIVVDTHRPVLVESPELVEAVSRLVVIDHHRKAEDVFSCQTLSYMESYASSASELVTEMLQYTLDDKKDLSKVEADALLAGIMLDTNRFAVKAGVRTFEAASWLKRSGADLQTVRRYFQADSSNFRARAEGIANARIIEGGIAMSICSNVTGNTQIINSQVADELLTIKGIEASFVAGSDRMGGTVISARSLGNINVQKIMEHFGGGGHMNTAGARVDCPPEEILDKIEEFLKTTH
ncbi:MAG: DHH family phosphoesterase [Clostridiales bacterium]|nr:DHH family phosphoesterase [Clostridiales bacterium]MDD7035885.1 DHH family phosphoesterase [Bacillota bacterium]MDY2920532.1 DHH family phosphoesterase [Lentihominibacter sp.]